jgi:hypothetical protein
MEKEYIIRRVTEKGKLKTPNYQTGQPVASWRTFKTEKEAIEFAKEYSIDNFVILTKYFQPRQETTQRFD